MRKKVIQLQDYRDSLKMIILMLKDFKNEHITKDEITAVLDNIMKKFSKKHLYVDGALIMRQRDGSILICLPGVDDNRPIENAA